MSINDAVDCEASLLADEGSGLVKDSFFLEIRGALLSKLESVSTPGSSAKSNDESAFIAFMAATGDKLGLGKDMS